MTLNANSKVQYAIQIKNRIIINANVSLKNVVRAQKIIAGTLAHVFVRMLGI